MWGPERITARRLRVLVEAIPVESAYGLAVGAFTPWWSTTDELLALVAELVHDGNRAFVMAHSKKGTPAPKPLAIPRPKREPSSSPADETAPKKRQATSEELLAWFGGNVRFTGRKGVAPSSSTAPRRCARGHFVGAAGACSRCEG